MYQCSYNLPKNGYSLVSLLYDFPGGEKEEHTKSLLLN